MFACLIWVTLVVHLEWHARGMDLCTALLCSCQDDSEILEDDGISKTFAYDDNIGNTLGSKLSRAMSSSATMQYRPCK
ncbi:hypothetical protein JB92DRAFT_3066687 [Gautieria morchelliformis]|nr:hypothetical protein JB92DRAFT_3066687 [Gautieria morchelliformis]